MTIGVGHLLTLSAFVFSIGLFGLLARRDLAGVLVGLVLMVTASSVALVGFARFGYSDARPLAGMAFALLVTVVLAAEVAVGVGLLLVVARRRGGIDSGELDGDPQRELRS